MPRCRGAYSTPFPNGIPGPYVSAHITKGDGSGEFRELPALLDTGADITLVPQITIVALGLQIITEDLEIYDATGHMTEGAPLYRADIQIAGLPVHTMGISSTTAPVIYIGRDLLLDYVATFNGPGQAFTVD